MSENDNIPELGKTTFELLFLERGIELRLVGDPKEVPAWQMVFTNVLKELSIKDAVKFASLDEETLRLVFSLTDELRETGEEYPTLAAITMINKSQAEQNLHDCMYG